MQKKTEKKSVKVGAVVLSEGKRGRGRPRKNSVAKPQAAAPKRGRGRPRKVALPEAKPAIQQLKAAGDQVLVEATYQLPIERAVRVLNEAMELDPQAMGNLLNFRVSCNDALADHPSVVVQSPPGDHAKFMCTVGILGILNGVLTPLTGKRVAVVTDDKTGEFKGFQVYDLAGEPVTEKAASDAPQVEAEKPEDWAARRRNWVGVLWANYLQGAIRSNIDPAELLRQLVEETALLCGRNCQAREIAQVLPAMYARLDDSVKAQFKESKGSLRDWVVKKLKDVEFPNEPWREYEATVRQRNMARRQQLFAGNMTAILTRVVVRHVSPQAAGFGQ